MRKAVRQVRSSGSVMESSTVYGIDHAMYGEIVAFENGVKGMVQDVRQNEIGIILFGRDTGDQTKAPKWFVPGRKPVFQ